MRIRLALPDDEPLRDPDLRRFWLGESAAMLGGQVSLLALPLAALLVLKATPVELGLLRAAVFLPFLLVTLPAGAWLDRVRRRPVLLSTNLLRAAALGLVPLAAVGGALSLPLLLAVALAVGALTVLFEVAYLAYLPSLVPAERIGPANVRLQASASVAQIGGPGLAGLLVGAVGAPIAIGVDALSLAAAGVAISRIRRDEPAPDAGVRTPLRRSIAEGLRFVLGQPILRALAGEAGMFNVLYSGAQVAFLVHATGLLGFSPSELGLAYSIGGLGALAGSLGIGRVAGRVGYGPALMLAMLVGTVPFVGLGLAAPGPWALPVVAASMLVGSCGVGAAIVLVVTLRQTAIPTHMLGRAQATYRLLTYGAIPVGAVLGGALVDAIGAQGAVLVCTLGIALAPIWIALSKLPRLRTVADARMTVPEPDARAAARLAPSTTPS